MKATSAGDPLCIYEVWIYRASIDTPDFIGDCCRSTSRA